MARILAFSLLVLAMTQLGSSRGISRKFFPSWKNCGKDSAIEIIDLYLDHQPKFQAENNTVTLVNTSSVYII